jgi:glutaconate CoA-transferase subunit B
VRVITDLCVMEPDPVGKELTVTSLHPGVSVEQVRSATGWDVVIADDVATTAVPTEHELDQLRQLKAAR